MEAVILCGIQASGKTRFFRDRFLDTHVRISRDLLRTAHRERRFLELCFETGQRFVVDKTNATPAHRRPYVDASRDAAGEGFDALWRVRADGAGGWVVEEHPRQDSNLRPAD